jgi:pimeloyl-ACP methyl ester carboxylesterase
VEVTEHTGNVAGLDVHWREAAPAGGSRPPILYVHGNPTASWLWAPFLERTGGVAPDLPGFGSSAKPADFDYSIGGYAAFLEAFAAHLGLDSTALVVNDWGGGAGLGFAQRRPARIERLVVIDSVPLLPGYRWHRLARRWRRPLIGELAMGFTSKWVARRYLREATTAPGGMPDDFVESFWPDFDHGTQRAILKLYRSAPEDVLARAGERLGDLRCPALVLWGEADPYIPPSFARAYADALGGPAEHELLEGAGHWPWIDRPDVIDRVAAFLGR